MDAATFKQLQQVGQVFHTPGEPVQFRDDDGVDFAVLNQGQEPLHTRPVQVPLALPGVDDDLSELRLLERGHGPYPALLRGQAVAFLRLPISAYPCVSDCSHYENKERTSGTVSSGFAGREA